MTHNPTHRDPAVIEFGRIVSLTFVWSGHAYRIARTAAEHDLRRQLAQSIAAAGITPPADDDMPVTWVRAPSRAEFDAGEPYREVPVTDGMVVADDDTFIARIEGMLERADDGRTVLTPTGADRTES